MGKQSCHDLRLLELRPIGQRKRPGEFFELRLENPGWDFSPGQFVMLRPVSWDLQLVWGRPFSIHRLDNQCLSVFFQVVGRGTSRLARLSPGDMVTVWGPLGNSFAVEPKARTLILAAGVGIAPFLGYVQQHPAKSSVRMVMAHRMPLECYPYAEIADLVQCESIFEETPNDLPRIIDFIGRQVAEYADDGLILACGPTPFMRTVANFAEQHGARAQVSLENRMACGVGGCLGCVCQDDTGHNVQVCTRGPVFWSDKVRL